MEQLSEKIKDLEENIAYAYKCLHTPKEQLIENGLFLDWLRGQFRKYLKPEIEVLESKLESIKAAYEESHTQTIKEENK